MIAFLRLRSPDYIWSAMIPILCFAKNSVRSVDGIGWSHSTQPHARLSRSVALISVTRAFWPWGVSFQLYSQLALRCSLVLAQAHTTRLVQYLKKIQRSTNDLPELQLQPSDGIHSQEIWNLFLTWQHLSPLCSVLEDQVVAMRRKSLVVPPVHNDRHSRYESVKNTMPCSPTTLFNMRFISPEMDLPSIFEREG